MKRSSFAAGLAVALTLSASVATVATAQGRQRPDRAGGAQSDSGFRRGPGGQGRRGGGPDAMLLRGITLSASQQARLEALRTGERQKFDAQRPRDGAGAGQRGGMGQRQPGDTAGMGARRAEMEQRREQRFASIRSILDAQQRAQFDKNVAEMKTRGPAQFGRGGRGGEHKQP